MSSGWQPYLEQMNFINSSAADCYFSARSQSKESCHASTRCLLIHDLCSKDIELDKLKEFNLRKCSEEMCASISGHNRAVCVLCSLTCSLHYPLLHLEFPVRKNRS